MDSNHKSKKLNALTMNILTLLEIFTSKSLFYAHNRHCKFILATASFDMDMKSFLSFCELAF